MHRAIAIFGKLAFFSGILTGLGAGFCEELGRHDLALNLMLPISIYLIGLLFFVATLSYSMWKETYSAVAAVGLVLVFVGIGLGMLAWSLTRLWMFHPEILILVALVLPTVLAWGRIDTMRQRRRVDELGADASYDWGDVIDLTIEDEYFRDVTLLLLFTELSYLDLCDTAVQDVLPIKKLTKLLWLDLRGTSVSAKDVEQLSEALPMCEIDC